LWIETHPNGNAYLACGEDYQGSTVIELNTGKRMDFLPEAADKGHGFCWVGTKFDVTNKILIARGCIWACPFEYRFYDFSDPMAGWPEIESDNCVDEENFDDEEGFRWPDVETDGTIRNYKPWDPDDGESPDKMASIQTYKREGLKLALVSEWVSEAEKKLRAEREADRQEYKEKMIAWKATDPLYLAYVELLKDPELKPEANDWTGITHEGWCPTFKVSEQRFGRRIMKTWDGSNPYTIELDWGTVSGPIKLTIYKDGKHKEDKFFDHSAESMHAAFAYAKEVLRG
jgi:hypothetical protein